MISKNIHFSMNSHPALLLLLLISALSLHVKQVEEDKLIMVQVLFRHGIQAQTPIRQNMTLAQLGLRTNYFSELSPAGLRMQYELGKILHKKYWKKLFGSSKVSFTDIKNQLFFRTTAENRTSQSSQAFTFGFLQNLSPQMLDANQSKFAAVPYKNESSDTSPGPVYGIYGMHNHYVRLHEFQYIMTDSDNGDFLRMNVAYACPMQATWFQTNFQTQQNTRILSDPRLQQAFASFKRLFNLNITMAKYGFFFQRLTQKQFLGQLLPPVLAQPSPLKTNMYALYNLIYFIMHTSNETQVRATMLGFFSEVLSNMKDEISPNLNRKWYSYASHKLTFLPLLSILGLSSVQCVYQAYLNGTYSADNDVCINLLPTYASSFTFELYKSSNGTKYFQLNFNGDYLKLPICGGKVKCPLEQFEAWFNTWNDKTVKQLCGYKPSGSTATQ